MHRVLLLPRRGLHFLEAGAHHHGDFLAAGAAARGGGIHRGIAPPSTTTRRPILLMSPRETLEDQSMPIWMLAPHLPFSPGTSRSRPRGAPEPTDHIKILGQQCDAGSGAELHAEIEDVAAFPRRSRIPAGGTYGRRRLGVGVRKGAGVAKTAVERAPPCRSRAVRLPARCACRCGAPPGAAAGRGYRP